jgi:sugar phosphate isomerase/epimerase
MNIQYICPHWGCENDDAAVFVDKVLSAGYQGIEINLPPSTSTFTEHFIGELEDIISSNKDFVFIPQQLTSPDNETVDAFINKMKRSLLELVAYQPTFINSHTGKDYYSFDDNCRIIEAALNISSQTGVRILHETHRGRFSFHAASLLPYLKKFPELELVGDFSHFCTVSESLLQDQEEIIQQIIPHVSHIHARVGHEQGPQVNDPQAPEWQNHFHWFVAWWQEMVLTKEEKGWQQITITPEFGPFPYMPQAPYTKQPLSNQWDTNVYMMNTLKQIFR